MKEIVFILRETYEKDQLNNMLWNLIKDYDVLFYVSPKGVKIEDNGVRTTDAHYRNSIDMKIKSIIRMQSIFIDK